MYNKLPGCYLRLLKEEKEEEQLPVAKISLRSRAYAPYLRIDCMQREVKEVVPFVLDTHLLGP